MELMNLWLFLTIFISFRFFLATLKVKSWLWRELLSLMKEFSSLSVIPAKTNFQIDQNLKISSQPSFINWPQNLLTNSQLQIRLWNWLKQLTCGFFPIAIQLFIHLIRSINPKKEKNKNYFQIHWIFSIHICMHKSLWLWKEELLFKYLYHIYYFMHPIWSCNNIVCWHKVLLFYWFIFLYYPCTKHGGE